MKNKLASALLSLLIAFGLWVYVITEISPGSETIIYDIPVTLTGETALTERGLMITDWSDTAVDLKLSGNRTDLNELNKGNITLMAELSNIYDPGVHQIEYKISYPGDKASNAYTVESQTPKTISVTVEKRDTKEVEVLPQYTGTTNDDYIYRKGDITMDYEKITVTGPGSVVEKIQQAIITIDLTDQTESISQNYRFTLCDSEGNAVDSEMITVNVEEVHVDLTIHRIKEVKLDVTITNGGGATEQYVSWDIDPLYIKISGSDAALEQVGDTITLGEIRLAEYEDNTDLVFTIPTFEGVTNETGKTEATVSLKFKGLGTREITIEDVAVTNVPEGYVAEIINEKITVKVRGPAGLVSKLTAENMTATVDFSSQEVGISTYRVSVAFDEEFTGVGVLGKPSISASLQEENKK